MSATERPVDPHGADAETAWPLLPRERTWRTRQLFVVLLVAASATWCYVIGEYVGYYLPLWPGALAMTAGVGLGRLASVIHPYPTQAEAIRQLGDMFNRTRLTPKVKRLFAAWLRWNR